VCVCVCVCTQSVEQLFVLNNGANEISEAEEMSFFQESHCGGRQEAEEKRSLLSAYYRVSLSYIT